MLYKEENYMAIKTIERVTNEVEGLVIAEGILAVLFGIIALFYPGETLVILIALFGIFVLAWGIINLVSSIVSITHASTWWLRLIFSVLIIGLGVFLLRNPAVSFSTFILLVGFTFIIRGIVEFVSAFFENSRSLPKEMKSLAIIGGIVGVIAGLIVLAQPVASGVALVWIIGLYAVLEGSLVIATAIKIRSIRDSLIS